MKKLFFYLAVAMLGTAAVSCQKEMVVEEGNGNVTFTIQTPEVATKAIADGMNVNIVHYEIYKNETGHKNSLEGTSLIKGTVPMTAKGASLTLNLLQGQEYVGLFWAQVDGKSYYDVTDLRNVKVAYPNEENNLTYANDEARAAFCQKKVFSTGKNVSVVLERPFAQINLGTTIADLNDDYLITLEQSSMTVTGVANSFNVAAMTAGTTATNVAFSYATVPYVFEEPETLVANNKTWAYAGMNYVLVPGDASTVNVTYSIKTDVGTVTRNIPAVPVQKNYRTNLLGNLLTQETAIEIVVDERFADHEDKYEGGKYGEIEGVKYVKVVDAAELADAVANEHINMVILAEDVTVESQIQIRKNMILDLNGKTLTAAKDGSEVDAIWVRDNAEVVITGNGTINATFDAVFATGTSKLTIENGTFVGVAEAVFAQANAQVIINGGTFKSTQYPEFTLNLRDRTGKGENDTATITVYGGTCYQFNPQNNAAEGAGTNFVAEGYWANQVGDNYIVTKNDVTIATTLDKVKDAFASGGTIILADDIKFEKIIAVEPGKEVYMNLNGKTVTVDENTTSNTLFYVKDGGKLIIDGDGVVDLGAVSTMAVFAPYGELVIENGTFIRDEVTEVTNKTTGLFMGAKTTASNVTINGGYFDAGYYNADAADIEEILAGTKELVETDDDIAKRGNSKDANKVRVAIKDNVSAVLNHSGYGVFKIYGGTFVGANPAWGDEGCMLPTTPNYLRPWSYYQGALLDGQTFHEDGIVLPEGYTIAKGATEEGVPTYTVTYSK